MCNYKELHILLGYKITHNADEVDAFYKKMFPYYERSKKREEEGHLKQKSEIASTSGARDISLDPTYDAERDKFTDCDIAKLPSGKTYELQGINAIRLYKEKGPVVHHIELALEAAAEAKHKVEVFASFVTGTSAPASPATRKWEKIRRDSKVESDIPDVNPPKENPSKEKDDVSDDSGLTLSPTT